MSAPTSNRHATCPKCQQRMSLPAGTFERVFCPTCGAKLRIRFGNKNGQPTSANESPRNSDFDFSWESNQGAMSQESPLPLTPQPVDDLYQPLEPPPPLESSSAGNHGVGLANPRRFYQLMWWLIRWIIPVGGAFIAASAGSNSACLFFIAWFWIAVWLGDTVARGITALFVHHYSCPACHEVYPCSDVWRCGCGFQDHRRKHVLDFTCPKCGNLIGFTECERCSTTIRLQQ